MNSCQSFAKTLTIGFSGSGLGDLHFFGVAMLLLFLHKLHMVLTVGQLKQFFMLNLKHYRYCYRGYTAVTCSFWPLFFTVFVAESSHMTVDDLKGKPYLNRSYDTFYKTVKNWDLLLLKNFDSQESLIAIKRKPT